MLINIGVIYIKVFWAERVFVVCKKVISIHFSFSCKIFVYLGSGWFVDVVVACSWMLFRQCALKLSVLSIVYIYIVLFLVLFWKFLHFLVVISLSSRIFYFISFVCFLRLGALCISVYIF